MTRSSHELDLFLRFMQGEPGSQAAGRRDGTCAASASETPGQSPIPPDVILRDLWTLIDGSAASSEKPDRSHP